MIIIINLNFEIRATTNRFVSHVFIISLTLSLFFYNRRIISYISAIIRNTKETPKIFKKHESYDGLLETVPRKRIGAIRISVQLIYESLMERRYFSKQCSGQIKNNSSNVEPFSFH